MKLVYLAVSALLAGAIIAFIAELLRPRRPEPGYYPNQGYEPRPSARP